ncbi:MAG: pilus assembly protein PilM [Gammaproteobacteria bacterium]
MWQSIIEKFTKKPPSLLGLDISSASIKLLELSCYDKQYRVESFAVVALPENAVVEKVIKDPDAASTALRRALQSAKTSLKNVAVAVADSSVISKVIHMDSTLTDEEIENQIAVEADKYIPYPLDEVSLDFCVKGSSENNPGMSDVLLVASHRDNVESRVSIAVEAGVAVKVVDVESYCIERACSLVSDIFPNHGYERNIAIVDIGASMTNLTVLHNLRSIFTREELFGGDQLTRDIMRHYGLNAQEANLAKKRATLPEDYHTELLQPFKEAAVLQIRRALQFFFSATSHNEVHQIVLSGGAATTPGLADLIQQQLGLPTMVINPFENMALAPTVDALALAQDASSLTVCCGLALRSFEQHDTH